MKMPFNINDDKLSTSSSKYPSIFDIEKSFLEIPKDSPYYNLAKSGIEQVLSFEREKLGVVEEESFSVKVETDLPPGSISLKVLGLISSGIQRVYSSAYNDLFGTRKSKGKIPDNILNSTELIMHSATPGSFNMHIDSKGENPILESHDEAGIESLSDLFVHLVDDEDATFVVEKYGVRTLNVLSDWFEILDREKVEFSLKNKNENRVILNQRTINRAKEKLLNVKTKEVLEPITITGIIETANSSTNSIIIMSNSNERIHSQGSPDIFEKGLVVKMVNYEFKCTKMIIVNEATKEEKITYQIIDVNTIV